MSNNTPPVSPFMAVLSRALDAAEIIGLIAVAVGLTMLYAQQQPGALEILNISMSVMAAVFFLRGYRRSASGEQHDQNFMDRLASTVVPKAGWIGCAVMTVGIQFWLLKLHGSHEMLMVGMLALSVVLGLCLVFILTKPVRAVDLMPLLYRVVPLWLVGGYLFYN